MSSILVGNVIYEGLMDYMVALCAFITAWVFLVLGWQVLGGYNLSSGRNEDNWVEMAWTFIPAGLVWNLCDMNLDCLLENPHVPVETTIKAIGRQWYWSYEITGVESGYDSMILDFIDSVDKPLRVNVYDFYHLVVGSSDVIHSFSLPELHLKVDAIPGRVNEVLFYTDRVGLYIGYCSELCGAGHAYMPIVVESVVPDYKPVNWEEASIIHSLIRIR